MSEPTPDSGWIPLDGSLRVGIQQTLRVPARGGPYPLPPALGRLRVRPAAAVGQPLASSPGDGDFVVVLHRQEAMWLQFNGAHSENHAVKISVGALDALTGLPWNLELDAAPQNYIVCPYQPWLDGFKSGAGVVRQFVTVPLDSGTSVESQLSGRDAGGIMLACFRMKSGAAPAASRRQDRARELAVGAGGEIRQRIYPDPYGVETWATTPAAVVRVRLIDAAEYARVTGEPVPPSAIDADTYSRFGLPWFEVYDADRGDVAVPAKLTGLNPVSGAPDGVAARDPDSPVRPEVVRPIPPRSRKNG